MAESILARLDPRQIVCEPYPFVHATEALAPDYYRELADAFPSMERIVAGRPLANNHAYLINAPEVMSDTAMPRIWSDFFAHHTSHAFLEELLDFWRPAIEREYPDIENRFGKPLCELTTAVRHRGKRKRGEERDGDVMMDVQFGVNSPVTAPTTVRGPHVDNNHKLFAGLLYFRLPQDDAEGGDLCLYRFRSQRAHHDARMDYEERFVEPFRTIPYHSNSLIMWLNTARSLHGVTPRQPTPMHRRYVNLIGEAYALTTDGFFPLRRSLLGGATSAVRRLVSARAA
ncbi:MAG TPA: 2OG-Fe(II) oxygenase [Geminicoccaceae bacterium]|nr:2OG-Fe(II) oxygenase [Geminicoccaceae bacterium]